MFIYSLVSSSNNKQFEYFMVLIKSLIKIENNKADKLSPCGTPEDTLIKSDKWFSHFTI